MNRSIILKIYSLLVHKLLPSDPPGNLSVLLQLAHGAAKGSKLPLVQLRKIVNVGVGELLSCLLQSQCIVCRWRRSPIYQLQWQFVIRDTPSDRSCPAEIWRTPDASSRASHRSLYARAKPESPSSRYSRPALYIPAWCGIPSLLVAMRK